MQLRSSSFSNFTPEASAISINATLDASGFIYCSADADADGTCDGLDDCVGAFDECGVCNGEGPVENFDCDGNCVVDTDCAGECGGTSAEDDCGVCNGDNACQGGSLGLGAFDPTGSLEVTYDFGGPVAGFQFDVTGLSLTGGSGGAAGDAGMTVSAGGATVVGFSFTNSEIPAGSGVLTVLGFNAITADATELSLGNFGALTDATGNTYEATAGGSVDHPSDCAGTYYGDAIVDECGECGGSGIADGACDCDGNVDLGCGCGEDGPSGCDDTCGSTLADDECGVCGGDDSSCTDDCGVVNGDGSTCIGSLGLGAFSN